MTDRGEGEPGEGDHVQRGRDGNYFCLRVADSQVWQTTG